jgi:hypothetical protein
VSDKTHVVIDIANQIVLFADQTQCETWAKRHNAKIVANDGDPEFEVIAAAIFLESLDLSEEISDNETLGVYRHLAGEYLFAIDGSWLEQVCDDGLATDPIEGQRVFLLDSMDPAPDGTSKV